MKKTKVQSKVMRAGMRLEAGVKTLLRVACLLTRPGQELPNHSVCSFCRYHALTMAAMAQLSGEADV